MIKMINQRMKNHSEALLKLAENNSKVLLQLVDRTENSLLTACGKHLFTLNAPAPFAQLFQIDFTPKGTKTKIQVHVWAKNRLDAHNFLILHSIWGKQHEVRPCPYVFNGEYHMHYGVNR